MTPKKKKKKKNYTVCTKLCVHYLLEIYPDNHLLYLVYVPFSSQKNKKVSIKQYVPKDRRSLNLYKSQEQKIQKEKKHYTGIYSNSDERNLEHRCEEGEPYSFAPFSCRFLPQR